MRSWALYFLLFWSTAHYFHLFAQASAKPNPTFTLAIQEDMETVRTNPALHYVQVSLTRRTPGVELEQFHKEAEGMYDMIVVRNGVQVKETAAMLALRNYRKSDRYPTIEQPRALKTGDTWTTRLDVSDYYDMRQPGMYEITVTRESMPMNPAYSVPVRSNTIAIVVPRQTSTPNMPEEQKPRAKFTLTLSPSDPEEPIPTTIEVQRDNTSDSVIREARCWPFMGMYNVFVSRNGEPLQATDQMRALQQTRSYVDCPGNETLNEILPGEFDADDLPLSNFFDISKPGSYEVYVTRKTYPWNPAKSVTVESNSISFTVSPPSDDPPTAPE